MTDLNNPEEFALLYGQVNDLEQIRNAMHEPEPEPKPARYRYEIVGGKMVKVEGEL